ncbi:MAG: Nramp family divalent metal transporter [bacterium]
MNRKPVWKSIGPGLLWAAAAIGVSHLVQSTRAGAVYGYSLIWAILLANLFKYPFFEYGPRYASATGESLLEGYRRLGKGPIALYAVVSIGTTFSIMAAVTIVTASIATQLFSPALSPLQYTVLIMVFSAALLFFGKFPALDTLVKAIIVVLTVSSLAAVTIALRHPARPETNFIAPHVWTMAGVSFLVALIGWMPSAIDISVWHSLWTLERAKQTSHQPTVREALIDFNIGYFGTAIIALFFLLLGTLVMYGTGETFSSSGAGFAAQLIGLYTRTLGEWSRPIILIAAFTTMFSTTLTCADAFPRVLRRLTHIILPKRFSGEEQNGLYWIWMAIVMAGALLLLTVLKGGLTFMVDVATTLSFLTAPILGYLNLRVVTSGSMPPEARPGRAMIVLSWLGIVFGTTLGVVYIVWRIL